MFDRAIMDTDYREVLRLPFVLPTLDSSRLKHTLWKPLCPNLKENNEKNQN